MERDRRRPACVRRTATADPRLHAQTTSQARPPRPQPTSNCPPPRNPSRRSPPFGVPLKQGKRCLPVPRRSGRQAATSTTIISTVSSAARAATPSLADHDRSFEPNPAIESLENWRGPPSHPHRSEDERQNARMALGLWEQAQPIASTLAEPTSSACAKSISPRCHQSRSRVAFSSALHLPPRSAGSPACSPCFATSGPTPRPAFFASPSHPKLAGGKVDRMSLGRWPAPRAIKLWPAENSLARRGHRDRARRGLATCNTAARYSVQPGPSARAQALPASRSSPVSSN